jgi:hypothetical protein
MSFWPTGTLLGRFAQIKAGLALSCATIKGQDSMSQAIVGTFPLLISVLNSLKAIDFFLEYGDLFWCPRHSSMHSDLHDNGSPPDYNSFHLLLNLTINIEHAHTHKIYTRNTYI